MAAELVGVDELGRDDDLRALHAGDADHLRVVDVHIDAQKDVADGGRNRFDPAILRKVGLVVKVAVGRPLDAQNVALGRKQAQVEDVVHHKAAGHQVNLVLDGVFAAGVQIVGRVPLRDIRFDVGKDHQVGKGLDLSERRCDTDDSTCHIFHLSEKK